MTKQKRGALIVFEGGDRCGKTTQVEKTQSILKNMHISLVVIKFPQRSSKTGMIIDQYLKNGVEITDQVVHLLFSANRFRLINTDGRL
jgi:dTMP kinase